MDHALDVLSQRFLGGIKRGSYSHAYFVSSPDTERSENLIRRAAALLCTGDERRDISSYADFWNINCAEATIDDIRQMQAELPMRTFSDGMRVVFLKDAQLLDEKKQNTLLKTLEEPPEGTVIFLSGTESGVLPTIRSRCTKLRLPQMNDEDILNTLILEGFDRQCAEKYAPYADGSMSRARRLCSDGKAAQLCDNAETFIKAILKSEMPFDSVKTFSKDRQSARNSAEYMLAYMRKMLENAVENGGLTDDGFTISIIGDIIKLLTETLGRIDMKYGIGAAFDRLIAGTAQIIAAQPLD